MWFLALLGSFLLLVFLPWHRVHAVWFSHRAKAAYRDGHFEEAARLFARVRDSRLPTFARAARMSIASLAMALGEHGSAIRVAEKELEGTPNNPEWREIRLQLYLTIAEAAAFCGEKAKSEKALSCALALGGDQYPAKAAIATAAIALRKRDPKAALAALEHQARPEVGYQRAACLAEVLRQYARKQSKASVNREALEVFPQQELRHAARGWKELEAFVSEVVGPSGQDQRHD